MTDHDNTNTTDKTLHWGGSQPVLLSTGIILGSAANSGYNIHVAPCDILLVQKWCLVICCWCKNITSPTVQNPASVIIRGNNLLPGHNTESPMERLIWYRGSCESPSWYIPYIENTNLQRIPIIHICCIQHWVSNWILGCNTLWKNLHLKQTKSQFSCRQSEFIWFCLRTV